MRLMLWALLLLMTVAIMGQVWAYSNEYDITGNTTRGWGNATGNGTSTYTGYEVNAGFDMTFGVLAFVIAIMAVGVVAGINVLGSGLNAMSVRIIYKSVAYFGLWAIISVFGLPSLAVIPVFGWLLYFLLTLVYGFGVLTSV